MSKNTVFKPFQQVEIVGQRLNGTATGPVLGTVMSENDLFIYVVPHEFNAQNIWPRECLCTELRPVPDAQPGWLPLIFWQGPAGQAYDIQLFGGQVHENCYPYQQGRTGFFMELGKPYRRFFNNQIWGIRPHEIQRKMNANSIFQNELPIAGAVVTCNCAGVCTGHTVSYQAGVTPVTATVTLDTSPAKPHHGHKWMPVLYATYFPLLQKVAHQHGYALAVHGSFTRDMDLIAVPWTETAQPHAALVKACFEVVGWTHDEDTAERVFNARTVKPHGRTAYTIPTGAGGYVDLSIMTVWPYASSPAN